MCKILIYLIISIIFIRKKELNTIKKFYKIYSKVTNSSSNFIFSIFDKKIYTENEVLEEKNEILKYLKHMKKNNIEYVGYYEINDIKNYCKNLKINE